MKRHEFWRQQYRLRRYMEHLKEDDLQQRAKEIINNLTLLNEESKISPLPLSIETEKWMILWTHVLEEFVIRFGPYHAGFTTGSMKDVKIPDPRSPLAPKAANAVKTTSFPRGDYLFKYGKFKYLKQALNEKNIRISPASSYNDPSLSPAKNGVKSTVDPCSKLIRVKSRLDPLFLPIVVKSR